MTLSEFLSCRPEDEKIKIGTEHGAGFFFAGTVKQFRRDGWAFCNGIKRKLEANMTRAEKSLERLEYSAVVIPEVDVLKAERQASIDRAREAIETFVPFCDRETMDAFRASADADDDMPLVIIIQGEEDGSFWLCKEAERIGEHFSIGYGYTVSRGRGK